jgi:phosphate transport system permease protein
MFLWSIALTLIVAVAPLCLVLWTIVDRGGHVLDWAFLSKLPTAPDLFHLNAIGGIANAIIGSIIVDLMAAVVAVPLSIVLALYLSETETRVARLFRATVEILTGVPSILLGVFAYVFIVLPMHQLSALAASFALAMLMTPIITKAVETTLRTVPTTIREAALALGARRGTVSRRVVLPAARPGVITSVLLALARAMGETAPLLLVIGATVSTTWDWNPLHPMSAMPTLTYYYAFAAYPSQHDAAWGVALILICIILVLSLSSRLIAARMNRERR